MTLGIIGTAGRGPDGERLKGGYYRSMKTVAQVVCEMLQPDRLVSGGAAFSDHIIVSLYLEGLVPTITLHLPAEWTGHGFRETGGQYDTGRTSNYYHSLFSTAVGIDSLGEIQQAIEKGATVKSGAGGFKARNTDIANESDTMLAYTFGNGPVLKDGGSADTWAKFGAKVQRMFATAYDNYEESPCGCQNNYPDPVDAYHFDLNSRRLYTVTFEDQTAVKEQEEAMRRREEREALAAGRPVTRNPVDEARDLL